VRNFFSSVLANNQKGFGVAIKAWLGASAAEKNTRESLFICGSVNTGNSCSGAADCKTQTAAGCTSNLQDTALEYLDMIMLDYPAGDCDSIVGQWEAFEDMLKAGKVRVEGGRRGGGGVLCSVFTCL
jgi:diketogulonate reductase-like aldo/keto reductase